MFSCVPKQVIFNSHFEPRFGSQAVADVVKMIAVQQRRWATPEVAGSDLTLVAANELLSRLGWPLDSVDAIIYVSQTPDYKLPATACVMQHRLGLSRQCAAFDMSLGCSAYPYALWTGMSLLKASGMGRMLVCVTETMSKITDQEDRATALLFGDAATVTALELTESDTSAHFILGTDGSGCNDLIVPQGARGLAEPLIAEKSLDHPDKLHMDGWAVFNFTIDAVPKLVADSLYQANMTTDQVDYFLFHQANGFMLDHLSKKIKLPNEKFLKNIDLYGNTSCASIPLLISTELAEPAAERARKIVLIGFGVGYSWSSAMLDLEPGIPIGWSEA